jgi:hypothetical protein
MDLLVIAESIPICNTLPLKNRQVVGKAIALPYLGRHCLPNDKSQFERLRKEPGCQNAARLDLYPT